MEMQTVYAGPASKEKNAQKSGRKWFGRSGGDSEKKGSFLSRLCGVNKKKNKKRAPKVEVRCNLDEENGTATVDQKPSGDDEVPPPPTVFDSATSQKESESFPDYPENDLTVDLSVYCDDPEDIVEISIKEVQFDDVLSELKQSPVFIEKSFEIDLTDGTEGEPEVGMASVEIHLTPEESSVVVEEEQEPKDKSKADEAKSLALQTVRSIDSIEFRLVPRVDPDQENQPSLKLTDWHAEKSVSIESSDKDNDAGPMVSLALMTVDTESMASAKKVEIVSSSCDSESGDEFLESKTAQETKTSSSSSSECSSVSSFVSKTASLYSAISVSVPVKSEMETILGVEVQTLPMSEVVEEATLYREEQTVTEIVRTFRVGDSVENGATEWQGSQKTEKAEPGRNQEEMIVELVETKTVMEKVIQM